MSLPLSSSRCKTRFPTVVVHCTGIIGKMFSVFIAPHPRITMPAWEALTLLTRCWPCTRQKEKRLGTGLLIIYSIDHAFRNVQNEMHC